jgi:probable phosphoglycerate mutase
MKYNKYIPELTSCSHSCTSACFITPSHANISDFVLPRVPFYFIRHGETVWNQEGRIQGCTEIALNDKGIEQAHKAAHMLKGISIGTIITSPLQRAVTTAEIIAKSLGKPVTVIDEFKNACYGAIEGKSKADHRVDYSGWKTGYPIEAAECYPCFTRRVYKGFSKALQHPGPVLIVAHAGVHWPLQDALRLDTSVLPNATPILHLPTEDQQWIIKELQELNQEGIK